MPSLYNQTTKEVAALFDVDREAGLSTHEVDKRRAKYGKNRIDIEKTPLWKVLLEPFIDIFMLVLLAALVLSALQGNWIEAFTVAAIMVADAAIYYVQRFSTERILRSLQRELTQTVIVRRSGKEISIDTSELVPGDIVILHEGDRIPADGRILSESGLLSNESMLTGESEAIAKDAGALSGEKKVYEQTNMVFSGSFVITGSAEFIVTATGNNTEYGRIASLASNLGEESPIQVKMNRLVRQIALVVVGLAVVLLVIQLINGISFLSALEFTLAMIVSAVPEGLPIAISIILALGAKRMAKKKALVRELGLASSPAEVLDCSKLGNITDQDLANIVGGITIFARVTPEDKYRVLSAIKQTEICAMTGDGVNDVPALVGAHVGIAMGDSPSIVQDAGDIILLDNNFKNVTEAIKESRTVLTNIRRMLSYLLATNAGEALTMIGALIFFGSQMLTPIQILWINIVTDSLMVIPIGLEPAERRIFKQKPEQKDAPILPGKVIRRMVVVAIVMAVFTLGTYGVSLQVLGSKEQANTLAFTALVVMQWASAFSARGLYESALVRLKVPHRSFWLAMAGAIILQVLALSGPLMTITNTVAVPIWMILIVVVVCFFGPLAIFEVHKWRMSKG